MVDSVSLGICIPSHKNYKLKNCLDKIVPVFREFSLPIFISDNDDSVTSGFDIASYNYEYIQYEKNKNNIGADRNMIKVIGMAKTDYVFWLGDDDAFTRETICQVYKTIQMTGVGIDLLLIGFADSAKYSEWNDVTRFYLEYEPNPIYFGNIVLRKNSAFLDFDIERYDGTLHAYYGYILEMLLKKNPCKIIVDERIRMIRGISNKSWKGIFKVMLFCVPKFYKTLPEPFHKYHRKMFMKRIFYYAKKILRGEGNN